MHAQHVPLATLAAARGAGENEPNGSSGHCFDIVVIGYHWLLCFLGCPLQHAHLGARGGLTSHGAQRRALAPLPVAGLRLSPAVVEALGRVGLGRIAELAAVARARVPRLRV